MNILIVDDDQLFRSLLKLNFEEVGFNCSEAANANQAKELIATKSFSHAVLDLRMPGDSGLVLIEGLKAQNPGISILILTGFANHQTAIEAIKLGATHYLAKPVAFSEIMQAFYKHEGDPFVSLEDEGKNLDDRQKDYVLSVLEKNHGNISQTAQELDLHRRTLQRKLQKWGIR